MSQRVSERDWKYIRSVSDELLEKLCERINKESTAILNDSSRSAHQKYQALYKHIKDSDDIVAECFDDHRRSTLLIRLIAMQHYNVLTPQHLESLSSETRRVLAAMSEFGES